MRFITFIFVLSTIYSQAQTGINYQGAATNSQGTKLVNQNISLKISVLQGGVDGTTSYAETHNTTTDQFGLFNVIIGLGDVLTGSFDSIHWGSDAHFLKVELDAAGGVNYNLVSTSQMMSVPYAKYAENVNFNSIENFLTELNQNNQSDDLENANGNNDLALQVNKTIDYDLENKNLILFSTDKNISVCDSSGNNTQVLYNVQQDVIRFLTESNNSDTIFFLQSDNVNANNTKIMMGTFPNFHPNILSSIPFRLNDLREFKYRNNKFYFLVYYQYIYEIDLNNNINLFYDYSNMESFDILPNGDIIHSYGSNIKLNGEQLYSTPGSINDLEYVSNINSLLIKGGYSSGSYPTGILNLNDFTFKSTNDFYDNEGTQYYNQAYYFDNYLYRNAGQSIISSDLDNIDNHSIITGSNNGLPINGLLSFICVFNDSQNSNNTNNYQTNNLENTNLILFSTDKNISVCDSSGNNTQVLYNVQQDVIRFLTESNNSDTIFFLQSDNVNANNTKIMMGTFPNFHPNILSSIPFRLNDLREFKYRNNKFYFLVYYQYIYEIDLNNNINLFYDYSNMESFDILPNGDIIHSYGSNIKLNGEQLYSTPGSINDLEYVSNINSLLIKGGYSSGSYPIGILNLNDFTFNSTNDIYDNDGTHYYNQAYYFDNYLYRNAGQSIISSDLDNIDNHFIITGSNNGLLINGLLIFNN